MAHSPRPPTEAELKPGKRGCCDPFPGPSPNLLGPPSPQPLFLLSCDASPLLLPLSPHSSSFKQVFFLLASLVSPSSSPAPSPLPSVLSLLLAGVSSDRLSPFSISFGHSEQCQLQFCNTNLRRTSYSAWKSSQGKENISSLTCYFRNWPGCLVVWVGRRREICLYVGWLERTHVNRTMLTTNSSSQARPTLGPRAFSSLGIIITTTGVIAQEMYKETLRASELSFPFYSWGNRW